MIDMTKAYFKPETQQEQYKIGDPNSPYDPAKPVEPTPPGPGTIQPKPPVVPPSPTPTPGYEWDMPNARQSWMPYNTYRYGQDQEDWGGTINDDVVKQTWWRAPQWLWSNPEDTTQGYGMMYHPYWGWQTTDAIKQFYQQAGDTPVTWDAFTKAGFTKQTDPDWTKYFDPWRRESGDGGGGTGGGGGDGGGGNGGGGTGGGGVGGYYENPYQNFGFANYPGQWDMASNILSSFGMGNATAAPEAWQNAETYANKMAKTGQPISDTGWYDTAKQTAQTDIEDAIKQAAEQAGLRGLRWSTPMGRTAQDISGRRMAQFGSEWADRETAAMEAARARQMSAIPMLQNIGAGYTGLTESAKDRAMQAAGGLGTLGSAYAQLPLQVMNQASGMGTTMNQQQQDIIDPLYKQWYSQQPYSNPWLNYGLGFSGTNTAQAVPQMYQQSGLSSLLSGLGGLGSLLAGIFI